MYYRQKKQLHLNFLQLHLNFLQLHSKSRDTRGCESGCESGCELGCDLGSGCQRFIKQKSPGGVEALTIGAVLGFSFIVWLGLMTVAA
jgi:hypothetical protein